MNKRKLTIPQWAEADRPREKMMLKGPQALSDAELLAILIGSGSLNESAVELMRRILIDNQNNLNELGKRSIQELCLYNGVGEAKAITILAALELGKRRNLADAIERLTITSSLDAFRVLHPMMGDLVVEEFWVIYLNQGNKILDITQVSSGGLSATVVDVRIICREALLKRATSFIISHNHPSGSLVASSADHEVTKSIQQGAKTLDLKLVDHLIVAHNRYLSYADEGLL